MSRAALRIFVHSASEYLTDHASHGDGLICFSLLNGLAQRGHEVFAYAQGAAVDSCSERLHVSVGAARSPAGSLVAWEHAWRADRRLAELIREGTVDLVWRMHPYDQACPRPPCQRGRPLVLGPLFYSWPESGPPPLRHRIGIGRVVRPLARRGWQATLAQTKLLLCATEPLARQMRELHPSARVLTLPVIVDAPEPALRQRHTSPPGRDELRLVFTGNLVPQKNPRVFCDLVARLRSVGWNVGAVIVGDGPQRRDVENSCGRLGIDRFVRFIGRVPNPEVYSIVAEAHLLVSTSLGEPYGRCIVEGMAVGTPAVCHASGGPRDLIADGVDGLLVDRLDAQAYARRIIEFCEQGNWQHLSQCAQTKAQAWSSQRVLDSLECALLGLVEGRSCTT